MKNLFHELHVKLLWHLKYKKEYKNKFETGPMAIFIDTRSKKVIAREKEKYEHFIEYAAQTIKANRKTVTELIEYIKQKYGAEEYSIGSREHRLDLYNLLKNDYEDIFKDPELKEFDFGDIIREAVHRSPESQKRVDCLFDKIKKYHFNFIYYRFIQNPETKVEEQKYFKVGIETTSGKVFASGHGAVSGIIVEDIAIYYGVSEADIRTKSNTFIAYSIYLRDRGMLPYKQ